MKLPVDRTLRRMAFGAMFAITLVATLCSQGCAVPPEAIQQAQESALYNERIHKRDGDPVAFANAYGWWIQHYTLTGEHPPAWVIEKAKAEGAWLEAE